MTFGELGSTADPLALIGGSVETLRADADDLRARATELTAEADGPMSQVVASWVSANATRSAENRAALAGGLNGVADVYGVVAVVLDAHADMLEWAHGQAAVAIELWAEGVRRGVASGEGLLTLRPHDYGPFGPQRELFPEADPGAPLRRLAESVLGTARGEVRFSQTAAARVLDEFCAGMPDGHFHFDEFLAGIGDWVAGIADLAWRFNHIRAMVDPDAMFGDAQEMGQGLWDTGAYLAANPTEAVPVLLNTQLLHDRPGRWWGQIFPDLALTAVGGYGALSRSGALARIADDLADLSDRVRGFDWTDDTGAIDLEAFLRRDPVPLGDGTTLSPLSPAEEAAALARYEDLPPSALRSRGAQADFQTGVYGTSERRIDLPGGARVYPDGFTPQYGAIGDAKLVTSDKSWYVPETLSRPGLTDAAISDMDYRLGRMAQAADTLGGNGVIEITTNSPAAAHFIESRMEQLGLRGYVRIVEG